MTRFSPKIRVLKLLMMNLSNIVIITHPQHLQMEEHFVNSYCNHYSNSDSSERYFDFIHHLYEQMEEYRDQRLCSVLNRNDFGDFFNFCVEHMKSDVVDTIIQNREIGQICEEISFMKKYNRIEGE